MKFNKIILLTTAIFFLGCGGERTISETQNPRQETTTQDSNEESSANRVQETTEDTSSAQPETTSYKEKFINDTNCNQIIDNEFIVMCYDYKRKAVKAVSYTLMGDLVNELNIKDRPSFYVEKKLKPKDRVTTRDYTNSGYDKGHMAPDAAFDWSQESLDAVYTLANIIPQAPQVNRRSWAKLEAYVRDRAEEFGELTVMNVVKYGNYSYRMGDSRMAISKGYYKILSNEAEEYEECFYYSNKRGVSIQNDEVANHKVACSSVSN